MKKRILLWIILLLPYLGLYCGWEMYKHTVAEIANSTFVIISKEDMTLSVYNYKGMKMSSYPIACGRNFGDKEIQGDMKTPEGVFNICDIQNSSEWSHDFKDGKGKITGAYGPFFIRLSVPNQSGIGIHGTHNPNSIGTRITEGCVRMHNEDLTKLVKQIKVGSVVAILPSEQDVTDKTDSCIIEDKQIKNMQK